MLTYILRLIHNHKCNIKKKEKDILATNTRPIMPQWQLVYGFIDHSNFCFVVMHLSSVCTWFVFRVLNERIIYMQAKQVKNNLSKYPGFDTFTTVKQWENKVTNSTCLQSYVCYNMTMNELKNKHYPKFKLRCHKINLFLVV